MASQQVNRSTTSQVVETRELKILYEQETQIDSYMYSFFPLAIKIWNDLPQNVIDSNDIDQLKQKLAIIFNNLYTCMYVVACALYSSKGLHSITNNNNNNDITKL